MEVRTQFLRFIISGIISTFINFIIFYIALKTFGLNILVSSSLGYLAGLLVGYKLNTKWSFEIERHLYWSSTLQYLAVYLISLGAGLITLDIIIDKFLISALLANFLIIIQTTTTNFLMIKFIVFKR